MKKTTLLAGAILLSFLGTGKVKAQLNTNPDKFLGNITTRGQVNGGGYEFKTKWNQLTCENETKWSSVQGGGPNSWNWGGADNAYNYCKNNGLLFKFHCLAWGSQYPGWIENLSNEDRYKAIVNWMDAVKKKYPDIKMFDVVNEAIDGHQAGTHFFQDALGGKGVSGWDWIITAFELAHERWPDAILIYNDFNTFQWQHQQFIDLCVALRDYGAPIDAYGCQSHDLTGYGLNNFKQTCDNLQNKIQMPMFSTEYDIGTDDDNLQLTNYKEQIPYMWEKDYFAGLTLWGSTYGATWTTNGNSGILNKNGKNRPAYDWLVEYMKTDKAKTAKSPFPGMKKQVDLYIKPMQPKFSVGEAGQIDLRARMVDRKRKIERIDFYADNKLYVTLTEAPWVVEYTPAKMGKIALKAVLVADDGQEYTRVGNVNVVSARSSYANSPYVIPGTLQIENFDKGVEGSAFHDIDYTNSGNKTYRNDVGVDFSTGNSGGTVVSQTVAGEWMEYTMNVKDSATYSYDLTAVSGVEDAEVSLSLKTDTGYVDITGPIHIPMVKKNVWSTYKAIHGRLSMPLTTTGKQIIRLNILKGGAYLDKIQFKKYDLNENLNVDLALSAEMAYEKDTIKLSASVADEAAIKDVTFYINNVKHKSVTVAPYETTYVPTTLGDYEVMAIATDTAGMVSPMFTKSLVIEKKRIPFNDHVATVPGVIEAEDFDIMGEGFSFHDSDNTNNGGDKTYRTDSEGVDIMKLEDGGRAIVNTVAGEWLDYSVDVEKEGIYDIVLTVATGTATGKYRMFYVDKEGEHPLCTADKQVPAYRNENNYKNTNSTYLSTKYLLPAGRQILRLKIVQPFNIDKFELNYDEAKTETVGVNEIAAGDGVATYTVFTLDGAKLGEFTASGAEGLISKAHSVTGKSGAYILKNNANGESVTVMVK